MTRDQTWYVRYSGMPVPDGKPPPRLLDEVPSAPFFVVEYARRIPKRKREPLTDRSNAQVLFAPCAQHRRNADGACAGEALGTLEATYIVRSSTSKMDRTEGRAQLSE